MASNASLLKWSGLCAIVYGFLVALSYIASIVGIGYSPVLLSRLDPFQITATYANRGFGCSILIDFLSLPFLFPTLVGIAFYLKEIRQAFSVVGFIFLLVGSISMMLSCFIRYGVWDVLENRMMNNSLLMENQILLFHSLAGYLRFMSLPLLALGYLLWGLGFRRGRRPDRIVGTAFLFVFLSLCLMPLSSSLSLSESSNIFTMLNTLTISASFIMVGRLLRKEETPDNLA